MTRLVRPPTARVRAGGGEALRRASAALGEVVVRNGGRVLPDAPVAPAPAPVPEAAPVAGAGAEGGALRWMLSALAGGDADG